MRKPRAAKADTNAMNRTVSLTDGEWGAIGRWSAERGLSRARWMRECALTVDLAAGKARVRPLVLDAGEQRRIARTVGDLADDLGSSGDDAEDELADGLRGLLAARLRAMAQEGRREAAVELLRTVLGEERVAIVVAAFIPEPRMTGRTAAEAPGARPDDRSERNPPPQNDLFGS